MRTRRSRERRASTRYAGEEWVGDVEMFDADVDRMEVDRCVADENSDPNVAPPVVAPEGHVDKRRRAVRGKKKHPHVSDPAPAAADRSGEHLDVGDRKTSCFFCGARTDLLYTDRRGSERYKVNRGLKRCQSDECKSRSPFKCRDLNGAKNIAEVTQAILDAVAEGRAYRHPEHLTRRYRENLGA